MKTEKVKIGKIKNNPNNPRLIKDDKFKKLETVPSQIGLETLKKAWAPFKTSTKCVA